MYKNNVTKYYGLGWAFLRQVEKMYNGELIVFIECFFVYILESLKTCILTVVFVMCLPKKGYDDPLYAKTVLFTYHKGQF